MITFIICFVLLVVSYFIYGKYIEKLFGIDANQKVPSTTNFDGIDYVPMKKWKTFLIQLLNIAGLGPIFGAVLGATYGPVAFIWITFGGIFIGAVHDFASGYISVKLGGLSYTEIINHFLGSKVKIFTNIFIVFLLLLVGAVFMVGPAGLLDSLTGLNTQIWLFIILAYYFLATLLPIDKIIGKIYPIFGAALMFMALGLLFVIFTGNYVVPELSFENMKIDAANFPIIPTLFITIACGAVSGFHATQSPLMARCINNQKECKPVFFGAMIAESLIALIWAAIAMTFFGGVLELNMILAERQWNAAWVVNLIANTALGKIGGFLALIGVIVAPITSGDTAFRSARLIVADAFKINQQKIIKRLIITLSLFVIGYSITLINFAVLWRYFAWLNQSLSVATLWAATIYLARLKKKYFITMFPAMFMTFIVSDYLFISNQMFGLSSLLGTIFAGILTLSLTLYFIFEIKKQSNM